LSLNHGLMGEGSSVCDGRHRLGSTVSADGNKINYRIRVTINIESNTTLINYNFK